MSVKSIQVGDARGVSVIQISLGRLQAAPSAAKLYHEAFVIP
jgi:hypothetical protein